MQAADTVRIISCLEGGGKFRNKFSVTGGGGSLTVTARVGDMSLCLTSRS